MTRISTIPQTKPLIKVQETVFVPLASQLNYFQAEAGSNALPNPNDIFDVNVPVAVCMTTSDVHEESEQDEAMLAKKPFIENDSDWYTGSTYSKSERLVIETIRPSTVSEAVSVVTFYGQSKPAFLVTNKADFYRFRFLPFQKDICQTHKVTGIFPVPLLFVELAYAQTCHKWQGSAIKNLIIINEMPNGKDDAWKWRYTAITRASEKCIVVNRLT